MAMNITPITAAIALLLASHAYAQGQGGNTGVNGSSSVSPVSIDLIGDESVGAPGTDGGAANGQDGASFTVTEQIVVTDSVITGEYGDPGGYSHDGGGGSGGPKASC